MTNGSQDTASNRQKSVKDASHELPSVQGPRGCSSNGIVGVMDHRGPVCQNDCDHRVAAQWQVARNVLSPLHQCITSKRFVISRSVCSAWLAAIFFRVLFRPK